MNSITISQKNEISQPFTGDLSQARALYDGLGFDTIPIKPREKAPPLIKDWEPLNPAEIWSGVSEFVNLAIRCGGGQNLAVIDSDEANTPRVFDQTADYLCLLRLKPLLQLLKSTDINFEESLQIAVFPKKPLTKAQRLLSGNNLFDNASRHETRRG